MLNECTVDVVTCLNRNYKSNLWSGRVGSPIKVILVDVNLGLGVGPNGLGPKTRVWAQNVIPPPESKPPPF
ncbi:hypothetical protein CRG98_047918 [Punica granatum]|uniref:Uncharacterized protein n=1 Tax=Punica granatum TaxID=22663 RepID=A0A2I0HJ37_PUNGR|nr:hypothetical protein CRG98_047918 [Punica granatum]